MNNSLIISLLLPVATGLNGVLWSRAISAPGGVWFVILAGLLANLIICLLLGTVSSISFVIPTLTNMGPFILLTTLNTIVTLMWIYPLLRGVTYPSLSFMEVTWPLFSIGFGYFLFKEQVPNARQLLSAAVIMVGIIILSTDM